MRWIDFDTGLQKQRKGTKAKVWVLRDYNHMKQRLLIRSDIKAQGEQVKMNGTHSY